ncbi:unnamed protein product [Lathyrus sativus]|nr:unnamed protein product [Lathyrus sativus]
MFTELDKPYNRDELIHAMKNMKGNTAPGPDGVPASFYQNYWEIIGEDILSTTLNILKDMEDPQRFNSTYISLI